MSSDAPLLVYLFIYYTFTLFCLCISDCKTFTHDVFNSDMNLDLIDCVFSFCLQSVFMQYYRDTESDPDFSSEIKPITPERTEPEL